MGPGPYFPVGTEIPVIWTIPRFQRPDRSKSARRHGRACGVRVGLLVRPPGRTRGRKGKEEKRREKEKGERGGRERERPERERKRERKRGGEGGEEGRGEGRRERNRCCCTDATARERNPRHVTLFIASLGTSTAKSAAATLLNAPRLPPDHRSGCGSELVASREIGIVWEHVCRRRH